MSSSGGDFVSGAGRDHSGHHPGTPVDVSTLTIDLLPGATPPMGQIYPLSIQEQNAMDEYIKEALHQRFI